MYRQHGLHYGGRKHECVANNHHNDAEGSGRTGEQTEHQEDTHRHERYRGKRHDGVMIKEHTKHGAERFLSRNTTHLKRLPHSPTEHKRVEAESDPHSHKRNTKPLLICSARYSSEK
jgi:hypothetical protein